MLRIMMADDNQEFCELVAAYLEKETDWVFVGSVPDGRSVIDSIQEWQPDVLLLDLVMPEYDGLAVLESLRCLDIQKPKIIVLSALGQDDLVSRVNQLGVDYYLMKPFSLPTLVKRIRQIASTNAHEEYHVEQGRQVRREKIISYLSLIGMPPHYKGYRYLLEAVLLVSQDKVWLDGVTKDLYPHVGRRFGTSATQVERAIRHAIEITWEKGNLAELERLFPYLVDAEKGKPTNSSFMAALGDIINWN